MRPQRGFTLIELMVTISVLAILMLIALPTFLEKRIREQISASTPLADIAKPAIEAAWRSKLPLPVDNADAGLPVADKIVGEYVSSVTVREGAIHVAFGNKANKALQGKVLTFRPAVVEDAPVVPVTWLCGMAAAPEKMTAKGENKTDVPAGLLPLRCR